ncbi:bifunctional folylpolyglutamate synthase/dihydrofolate synthase [Halodesulfovibrio marinisediminis]|uniref:Dihydrofolate synthase/folylpolyglutamate synthase n=1 Tax=Halodesulfovibrio marinisediminis DSM 17456 TaxID=1121457 RepID=A0A1N6H5W6_9BACT|nr:Mur ligase family protein [Halodesulfovibrio marinisediminis]SIO15143.1 dihydrofolate synthase / folylpolyglutamate synthase [Halodesulfovibrio marinisediminis DSM 17456]
MSETERNFFATYDDFEAHLMKLGLFHMDLAHSRIDAVLHEAELKRPDYPAVQVVGTNGKGSTSSFLSAFGQATGLNVGLYTSPHFVTPRERILINGEMLDEEEWCDVANDVMECGGQDLTYFELLTVMAVFMFSDYEVDLAIFEAGLGGAHDATTAIERDLVVYTPIGLDHVDVLGASIEEIARDKAGAMRKGMPAVTHIQSKEALAVLKEEAQKVGAKLVAAEGTVTLPKTERFGLVGAHQKDNAMLALAAFKQLVDIYGWQPADIMDWDDVKEIGVADAWIAGRFQHVSATDSLPDLYLDGAHNEPAFDVLTAALQETGVKPAAIIFGCMNNKDIQTLVPKVQALTEGSILLPQFTEMDRAEPAARLATHFDERAEVCDSLQDALTRSKEIAGDKSVLLCGSLYLLAEFFALHPEFLQR